MQTVVDIRYGASALTRAPNNAHPRGLEHTLRRSIDIIIASGALLFLLPIMVLISLGVWLQDGGPIFFAHKRIGRDGRAFRCLKFRSMLTNADARLQHLLAASAEARREWECDHKLRDDPRITAFGAFLRRSSLDELPQLLNVLSGDMSLVGPRPIVDAEVQRYGRRFSHYCSVRPGITGLWQVSGRNDVSYRRRVAIDTFYASHQSLGLDLRILFATIPSVLLRKGSY